MAGEDDEEEPEEEGEYLDEDEEGEGGPPKKGGGAKLFIIVGAVLFLLVGGGVGAYFSGLLDSVLGIEGAEGEAEDVTVEGQVFYKLENITLNLNVEGRKARYLAVGLTLVLLNEADIPKVEALLPRITDYVVGYLRELKPEELLGSANFYRMREDLLVRVQVAVAPVKVTNVLFSSVVVQ